MKRHLSNNSKGLTCFDVSRKDSNCQKSCKISNVCYINNNIQDKMNKGYKEKMKRNFNLINSDKFVSKLTKEIRFSNRLNIRLYGNGDISYNQKQGLKQIDNICKLAANNPFNRFWVTTRNFNVLFEYFNKRQKPNNANFMLSVDFETNQFIFDFCKKHKIQTAFIVDKKKDSNCLSSQNKKSCLDNNCDLCFNYSVKPRKWFIHGFKNKEKFKDLK
jgi:hypothetical protein